MQKKLHNSTPIFLFSYVLMYVFYGVAILNAWALLALLLIALLFGMHRSRPRLKLLLSAVFLGNIAFMMTVMSWFRNIDAFGWQNIGPFSPGLVLMFALFIASAFCSLFVCLLWLLLNRLIYKTRFAIISASYIYVWGLAMMLTEIVRSLAFSLFVHHSQAPIEPSLNLFSVGPLVYGTPLGPFSRLVGFWGSSFLLFCLGAFIYIGVVRLLTRKSATFGRQNMRMAMFTLSVVVAAFIISSLTSHGVVDNPADIVAVAVSQPQQHSTYLKDMVDRLSTSHSDVPVIAVLPEYSTLLHPYSDASLTNVTYDGRKEIPVRMEDIPAYFVGTEDELSRDGRYVETYVVNVALQKIKRTEKTFLIPGGEYIPPLVSAGVKRIDPSAVINFSNSRSRKVLQKNLRPDVVDPIARDIATGPCSAILTPFHFRKQVAEGAVLLTSNVSYEQFARAPEYRAYTHRFARFTAYSTDRPFVIGARSGEAMVYDTNGHVVASSGTDILATYNFNNLSREKTPYVLLGDTVIVSLLVAIGLLFLKAHRLIPVRNLLKKGRNRS